MAGEYRSAFRGSGMEFDEVREYQPGDEVRSIDWNVTARQGRPFIKRFHEERELTVMFMVDMSASENFGSGGQSKMELAAELAAMLSFSAVRSNDKVGLILFTDRVELFIPPAKGIRHAMRIVREVLGFKPAGRGTNLQAALDFFCRAVHRRCVAFLMTDFQDSDYEKSLRLAARRHDMIAVEISDLRESVLQDAGLIEVQDAETGECCLLDTSSREVRDAYGRLAFERRQHLEQELRRFGVDFLQVMTDEDYERQLVSFFHRREARH